VSRADETRAATDRIRPRASLALDNTLAFAVDGGVRAAADARDQLAGRLAPRLDPDVVEVALLLLSELVNNCVLHGVASRPGARIDITASLFTHVLWVEVSDGGASFHYQPRLASPEELAGRGLYLVEQLSTSWGISGGHRASVWFELQRAA
jgi:anti-sigma regulatory factor (Ser/Thr protein kinase)